ncbi:MAG: polysaccharide deacetylase family protein [Fimbriimonadales bacterium]
MTSLALALVLQTATHPMGLLPGSDPGVDLRQEIRDIQWPKAEQLKLITHAYEPKTIALTFDDGPHGDLTLKLLGLLRQLNVKATFFVVGKMVDKAPWLVREEFALGHEIGNHTYDHPNLDKLTGAQVAQEYRACGDAIQRATGIRPKFCRPPGGRFDTEVLRAASNEGMWTVLWTDDPGDFARPDPKVLVERLDRQMKNGGILLLHDGIPQTLQVLPEVVAELRKRGYRFVTCSELLAQRSRAAAAYAHRLPSGAQPATAPVRRKVR